MPLQIGAHTQPIPGYTLLEPLGRGGFAEVWKADAPGGIPKAIKIVMGSLDDVDGKVPAVQELKALQRVKNVAHPFILGLERVDIVEGRLFIVMELADRTLLHRLEECQKEGLPGIPRPELMRYMTEICDALDFMNVDCQLQHLDIKPANLFLVHNHVKVADFGLVKDLQGRSAAVTSGLTPVYASPETFEGTVSDRSDQYSLAIVYQELLTGTRPITGKNGRQLAMAHVNGEPDVSALPEADREIVKRGLAKKPDARYASCGEFVEALKKATPARVPGEKVRVSRPATPTYGDFDLGEAAADPRMEAKVERKSGPRSKHDTLPNLFGSQTDTKPTIPKPLPTKKPAKVQSELPDDPEAAEPCPKCGEPVVDPGAHAWCSNCGWCGDLKGSEHLTGAGGGTQQQAPWTTAVMGALGIVGVMALLGLIGSLLGITHWEQHIPWLAGVAVALVAALAIYAAWPRPAATVVVKKKKKAKTKRQSQ